MATRTATAAAEAPDGVAARIPLSRPRIIEAALRFVDAQGLAELSMHRLGAELGVKGMSLYKHVENKHDVLNGIVELLWSTFEREFQPGPDWCASVFSFATSLRAFVHRHPNAAPLLISSPIVPEAALRVVRPLIVGAAKGKPPVERVVPVLRTVTIYALGYAQTELNWFRAAMPGCAPMGRDLVPAGADEELLAIADDFCGCVDMAAQFELGLDLMLRGLECSQQDPRTL
jgi:TetR/AcrR family transcriptional regulator, tetracycline repressor protein